MEICHILSALRQAIASADKVRDGRDGYVILSPEAFAKLEQAREDLENELAAQYPE